MVLNAKHISFVNDYMISQNATESYQKVYGCSDDAARKAGSRLLTNVDIMSEIVRRQEQINKKIEKDTGISVQWVIDSFKSIAERCMVAEPVMEFNRDSKQTEPTGEYKFDSSGANKAVESIGKYLGMFKEKVEHSGMVTQVHTRAAELSDEELEKIAYGTQP